MGGRGEAVKTNSDDVSRVEIFSSCSTRMNSDSTASPAKMSVQEHDRKPRQRRGQDQQ
jgi:hypothetical protein